MSQWFVYMLACGDGSIYTGISTNVSRRLIAHQSGRGAAYTRGRGPLSVLWQKQCSSESEARKEEARLKKLRHQDKLRLVSEK